MNRDKYYCPGCLEQNISFLKIENVGNPQEEAIFVCNICKKRFGIGSLGPEYLPNLVAILKKKYP